MEAKASPPVLGGGTGFQNHRVLLADFVATVVLGVLSGTTIPYTDVTMPTVSYGLTSLIGGAIAGYMAMESARSGAVHGFLATIIGGLVVLVALALLGTLVAGLIGLSVALFALFLLALSGIPGAVGGAIGAWLHGRGTRRDARRTAPR